MWCHASDQHILWQCSVKCKNIAAGANSCCAATQSLLGCCPVHCRKMNTIACILTKPTAEQWLDKETNLKSEINLLSCLHACRLWRSVLFLCSQTLYSRFEQQNSNPQHLQTTLNIHQQEPTQVMQPPVTVFQTSNCLHVMCSWTKSAQCIFRINPHTPRVCRWSPKLSQIHSCTRVK